LVALASDLRKVKAIDPLSSHASWMENFPLDRLPDIALPTTQKFVPDRTGMVNLVGEKMRAFYGDGNYEGYYQRSDEEMLALWDVAIAETRTLMSTGWIPPEPARFFNHRKTTPMHIEFAAKTVIVTGAAHGFGRAIAMAFAQRGAHVCVRPDCRASSPKPNSAVPRPAGNAACAPSMSPMWPSQSLCG
jgi:hypothetical protein